MSLVPPGTHFTHFTFVLQLFNFLNSHLNIIHTKKGQIHSFILTGPEWPWTARGLKVRDCKTQSLTVGWHDDGRLPSNFSVLMDINHF